MSKNVVNIGRGFASVDPWIDIKTHKPMYGVSVKRDGQWMRVAKDGAPYLASNKEEARKLALKLANHEDRRP
jgi:hypothetical protein